MLAKRRKVLVISGAHEQKRGKKKNNTRMWKKIQKIQKKQKKKQTSPECVELEVIPKR